MHRDRARLAYRSSLSAASVAVDWALLRALRPPRWRPWPAGAPRRQRQPVNRLCHVGLLRALHEDPHTGVEPGAVTAHRDCQHPRPACGDEPFNPACVLVRTDGPDDRKCEMTAIRFDAHRSGRECHAVLIAAFLLEPGKPIVLPSRLPDREFCQFQYASTAPPMPSA